MEQFKERKFAENVVKVSLLLKLFVVTWLVTLRERRGCHVLIFFRSRRV